MNFKKFKKSIFQSNISECDKKQFTIESPQNLNEILKFQQNCHLSVDERFNFLYPFVDQTLTKLPIGLSEKGRSNFVKIIKHKPFQCEYKPPYNHHHDDYDVGSIRVCDPIPSTCGIYYYEIKVLNGGKEGKISLGLRADGTPLTRQPGWDRNTFGYHGDDGHKFHSQGSGTPFGPTYGEGDVIGCGLNITNRTCFFTKNGKFLGIAFKKMPAINLYPTVGLHSKNERVEVNLGQTPFMYNIKLEMILNEAHARDLATDSSHS